MKLKDFPHCCTAKLAVDFGESDVAFGGNFKNTPEAVEGWLKAQINSPYNAAMATIVAITNSQQPSAAKALRKLGFSHSKWMGKSQHGNTKIRLWWISIPEAKKKLKELEAKK